MSGLLTVLVVVVVLALLGLALSVRIVKQYEKGASPPPSRALTAHTRPAAP